MRDTDNKIKKKKKKLKDVSTEHKENKEINTSSKLSEKEMFKTISKKALRGTKIKKIEMIQGEDKDLFVKSVSPLDKYIFGVCGFDNKDFNRYKKRGIKSSSDLIYTLKEIYLRSVEHKSLFGISDLGKILNHNLERNLKNDWEFVRNTFNKFISRFNETLSGEDLFESCMAVKELYDYYDIVKLKPYKKLVSGKGGILKSNKYPKDIHSKVSIQCANNHTFEITLAHLDAGYWCSECKVNVGEERVRCFFEEIFEVEFPKRNDLDWLKPLEIDGLNEEKKIGFERNGKHHYMQHQFFHKDRKDFINELKRFRDKHRKWKERGFIIIEVPYFVTPDEMQDYFIAEFRARGVIVPDIGYKIDWQRFDIYTPRTIRSIEEKLNTKGFDLITKNNIAYKDLINLLCRKCGYEYSIHATTTSIDHTNCPVCKKKKYYKELIDVCNGLNISLVEKEYLGSRISHELECNICKYRFKSRPNDIKNLTGCPKCNHNKPYSLNEIKEFVAGFNILADFTEGEYKNRRNPVNWICLNCGESFASPFENILKKPNVECPKCRDLNRIECSTSNAREVVKGKGVNIIKRISERDRPYYEIECSKHKHPLKMNLDSIKDHAKEKIFCPTCRKMEKANEILNGVDHMECVGIESINNRTHYQLLCKECGTTYFITLSNLKKRKKYCDNCGK